MNDTGRGRDSRTATRISRRWGRFTKAEVALIRRLGVRTDQPLDDDVWVNELPAWLHDEESDE